MTKVVRVAVASLPACCHPCEGHYEYGARHQRMSVKHRATRHNGLFVPPAAAGRIVWLKMRQRQGKEMDSLAGNKGVHVKKVPMRQCTGCGERKEKKDLIRVIRTPDEEIQVDFTGKKNGRGAYICNSVDCLRLAQKRNALSRSLKIEIPAEVYEELVKEMDNREDG